MRKNTVKMMSVLLTLALLLSSFAAFMSASADVFILTYEDEVDLLPEGDDPSVWEVGGKATITGSHDEGWTLTDLNQWGLNLAETPEWTNDGWFLYYDVDVQSGLCGLWLKWWDGNVSEQIAKDNGQEPGGEEKNMLPPGRYTGLLDLADVDLDPIAYDNGVSLPEQFLLNVYIIRGSSTVYTMKLLHLANIHSMLYDNGLLEIIGIGDMPNYDSFEETPWTAYQSAIRQVYIDFGVTSIGTYAFAGCTELTDIFIPDSVISIGDHAFDGCGNLTTIFGYEGSPAETYAGENGYTFEAIPLILPGDVNGDGNITVADYGLTLAHVRGTKRLEDEKFLAADVNGDGNISVADYGLILAHVRGTKLLF